MNNEKGFTLIEGMIVAAIIWILVAILAPALSGTNSTYSAPSSINSINSAPQKSSTTNETCIGGYIVLPSGKQLLNENGHGVKC